MKLAQALMNLNPILKNKHIYTVNGVQVNYLCDDYAQNLFGTEFPHTTDPLEYDISTTTIREPLGNVAWGFHDFIVSRFLNRDLGYEDPARFKRLFQTVWQQNLPYYSKEYAAWKSFYTGDSFTYEDAPIFADFMRKSNGETSGTTHRKDKTDGSTSNKYRAHDKTTYGSQMEHRVDMTTTNDSYNTVNTLNEQKDGYSDTGSDTTTGNTTVTDEVDSTTTNKSLGNGETVTTDTTYGKVTTVRKEGSDIDTTTHTPKVINTTTTDTLNLSSDMPQSNVASTTTGLPDSIKWTYASGMDNGKTKVTSTPSGQDVTTVDRLKTPEITTDSGKDGTTVTTKTNNESRVLSNDTHTTELTNKTTYDKLTVHDSTATTTTANQLTAETKDTGTSMDHHTGEDRTVHNNTANGETHSTSEVHGKDTGTHSTHDLGYGDIQKKVDSFLDSPFGKFLIERACKDFEPLFLSLYDFEGNSYTWKTLKSVGDGYTVDIAVSKKGDYF